MAVRALLGGTFDPVHIGHLHAARAVRAELGLASVTLVLSVRPPHRAVAASAAARWRMLRLAVADEVGLVASDIELERGGPSYSIDTIDIFAAAGDTIVWILGSDGLDAFTTWHRYDAFATRCHVAVVARPESEVQALPGFRQALQADCLARQPAGLVFVARSAMLDVSATAVRRLAARGEDASRLLTPAVWNYIRRRGLYRR